MTGRKKPAYQGFGLLHLVALLFRFPRGSSDVSASDGNGSALGVRLSFAEHLPDDGGQFSHDRHSGDRASAPPSDPFVPFAQPSVLPQCLVSDLRQEPPGNVAASPGDSAESLIVPATVTTTRRQAPVVRKTTRSWKTFHSTNTTSQ